MFEGEGGPAESVNNRSTLGYLLERMPYGGDGTASDGFRYRILSHGVSCSRKRIIVRTKPTDQRGVREIALARKTDSASSFRGDDLLGPEFDLS